MGRRGRTKQNFSIVLLLKFLLDKIRTDLKVISWIWFCVNLSALIIYCFAILILGTIAVSSSNSKENFLKIADNWNNTLISDIKISTQPCEGEYEPMLKQLWNGTIAGCDCTDESNPDEALLKMYRLYKNLYEQKCNRNMTLSGCRKVEKIDPIPMYQWKEGYYFCKKNLIGYTFLSQADILQKDGTCKPGYKMCGADENDPSYAICLPEGTDCPITDFRISENDPGSPGEFELSGPAYGSLNLWKSSKGKKGAVTDVLVSSN